MNTFLFVLSIFPKQNKFSIAARQMQRTPDVKKPCGLLQFMKKHDGESKLVGRYNLYTNSAQVNRLFQLNLVEAKKDSTSSPIYTHPEQGLPFTAALLRQLLNINTTIKTCYFTVT